LTLHEWKENRVEHDHRSTLIACSLERTQLTERLARWEALAADALEIKPTKDGLRLAFRAQAGIEAELQALVALERDCCGFANWSVRAEGERMLLDVSANGDVAVAAGQAMFGGLRAHAAAASRA
jgi:hypothetical protein